LESALSLLIEAAERTGGPASDALFSALYSELHRLAKCQLARQGGAVSVSATTLLHEAYLEMAGKDSASFPDRARFMGYAARVMRGLIIDHARSRRAQKRGGRFEITSIGGEIENPVDDRELVRISEALDELAQADASLAEVVDLKFFCGFTFAEIAAMKSTSERTTQRQWEKARIYLHRKIRTDLEA
jgi:RNA polymerase sigma factor (TIGR02999 family)